MKPMSDIIELSDHFRRSVEFENHDAVACVVGQAHKFACETTWIQAGLPVENEHNRTTANFLTDIMKDLTGAAQEAGLKRIVLPLHEKSPFAQFVQSEVLKKNDFGMPVTFRSSEYKKDLSEIGNIDTSLQTALDEGVRGVCAIDSNLKYKWSSDIRPVAA